MTPFFHAYELFRRGGAAPNGLTVYTDVDLQDGQTVGSGGSVHVPPAVQRQAQPFNFVVEDNDMAGVVRCNITWSTTPAAAGN